MKSLISEFLLRWNQNIDINVRGLSDQYEGLYVGDRLEIEIEKLSKWPDCAAPPHPEWRSSRNVSDTGETFGILDRQAQRHIDEQRGVIEERTDTPLRSSEVPTRMGPLQRKVGKLSVRAWAVGRG